MALRPELACRVGFYWLGRIPVGADSGVPAAKITALGANRRGDPLKLQNHSPRQLTTAGHGLRTEANPQLRHRHSFKNREFGT